MKIAIIGPVYPYRGGIAHYTARLAQELASRHEVKLISFKRQYPSWLYPGRSDKDPSQKRIEVPAEFILDSISPISWWRTANRIRQWKPDLIVFQWWVTFWAPAFAVIANLCRRSNIHVLFLIHNVLPHEGGRIHQPLARLALSQGDSFIVHTEEEKKRLHGIIPRAHVQVCSLGIYDALVESKISKEEARKRLNIPKQAQLLLFFGIVRRYKGLIYLLEALSILKRQGQLVNLIIAGEFWEEKDFYLQKIKQFGLSELILIEDRYILNEELPLFFTACDAAVAPYTGGTQSAIAAVALGYQIPLIATPKSAAGISAIDRNAITIVPAGNAVALADAIRVFFKNPHRNDSVAHQESPNGWKTLAATIEKIAR
jgi:glycosyltransferase involved in cell wall biosynthesis